MTWLNPKSGKTSGSDDELVSARDCLDGIGISICVGEDWGGKYCWPGVVGLGVGEYPEEEEPLYEELPEE